MKKVIVISGANLFSGGTLSIMQDCLAYADKHLFPEYTVIALVHHKEYFKDCKNIEFFEFRDARSSYLRRLQLEYRYYKKLSSELKPYLWLSINDMSSNVVAEKRAVYCHNPTPFKNLKLSDLWNQTQVFFFTLFYKYLYSINISKNNYVIVQQNWLRLKFAKMFNLSLEKIIVAPPSVPMQVGVQSPAVSLLNKKTFIFPTFPRPFKNIELIGEAVKRLCNMDIKDFQVLVTVDGSENQYSKGIVNKYGALPQVKFVGQISREAVFSLYRDADCLVFPSTLETWGLPITEFKQFDKPILLADLDYAHETLGSYNKGAFFDPTSPAALADLMRGVIDESISFKSHGATSPEDPIARNWGELFSLLLKA